MFFRFPRGSVMLRSDLVSGLSLKPVSLNVPGLSAPIFARPLSTGELIAFAEWRKTNPGSVGLCEKFFSLSVCDADGVRLFDDSPEDLALISGLSGAAVEKVAEWAAAVNGMTADPKA